MSKNIISQIYGREVKVYGNESTWVAHELLAGLFMHEWCYDHTLLYTLHVLKSLVVRNSSVRNVVIDYIELWKRESFNSMEPAAYSHVFLVKRITQYVSLEENELLNNLTDEIKKDTN